MPSTSKLLPRGALLASLVLSLSACDSSSSSDNNGLSEDTNIETVSVSSSGDNVTSASIDLVSRDGEQDFLVTLTPIVDPSANRPYGADAADRITVSSTATDQTVKALVRVKQDGLPELPCDAELEFGGGTVSGADVAFLVDTTASMGPAVTGIANSIETFAGELDAAGLGVRFAFVTFGDAYSTKRTEFSGYMLGTGTDEPPPIDPDERPLLDFTANLTTFGAFVEEVRTNVGNGSGGGDGPENYYGVAAAMNAKPSATFGGAGSQLSRRTDFPYYQVLVGDNCGHSQELPGATAGTAWEPPSVLELGTVLGDGSVTIHTVEREGFDASLSCAEDQVSLDEIADATGGAKLDFPGTGEVDLSALELADFITNFWLVTIDSECVPKDATDLLLSLDVTVDDDGLAERTQSFDFGLTLATTDSTTTTLLRAP